MGETAAPPRELYKLLGLSKSGGSFKELCNAYKSFVKRCQSPKSSSSTKDETQPPNADASTTPNEQNVTEIVQSPPPAPGSSNNNNNHHLRKPTVEPAEGFFLRPLVLLKKLSRKSSSSSNNNNHNSSSTPAASPTPSTSRSDQSPCSSSSARSSISNYMMRPRSVISAPMVFTQSSSLLHQYLPAKKAPPIEMPLECTLEELFRGRVKRIKITRHVINVNGVFVPEEETLKIKLMPGWKAGTKITFEGKGDERLGYLSSDVVFVIDEKPHHLFSRDGDNLIYEMEISLTDALTGCALSVPLIGRDNMWLSFADDEVISPGYEKVIRGQGMPVADENGKKKGDFLIRFSVVFPTELSDERRSEACRILRDCCYS